MNTKRLFSFLLVIGFLLLHQSNTSFAQLKTVSFQEIDSLQKIEKRNVVIFFYTDWCNYCQLMDQTTLKDDQIRTLLNDHFYFIKFNAETKEEINFRGHLFQFQPTGTKTGMHELSIQLATIDGEIAFPSICILNPENEIVFQYNEVLKTKQFIKVLKQLE